MMGAFSVLVTLLCWNSVVSGMSVSFLQRMFRRDENEPLPRGFLLTEELIRREGLKAKTYTLETPDGYLLQLTRILTERSNPGIPVFIMHGAFVSSDSWVTNGRSRDLPFLLADAGFDVWLGDERGNYYSRRHRSLSTSDPQFWNYSFHENAIIDFPLLVDHIIKVTGHPKMFYIGHSMGTTIFLALNALKPDYNDKFIAAALLSPVGYHCRPAEAKNVLKLVALLPQLTQEILKMLMNNLGVYETAPRSPTLINFLRQYCPKMPYKRTCLDLMGVVVGDHRQNINQSMLADVLSYTPAGLSTKSLIHMLQVYGSGFKYYDYGPKENMIRYNSTVPPFYPIHRVTVPTALLYGENDGLNCPKGVLRLAKQIANPLVVKSVSDKKYNHADFILGVNAKEIVYDEIISLFKTFVK